MRNRLACLLVRLSVAVALFAPLLAQTAQSQWKQYSYPSDGFSISSPLEPAFSKEIRPTSSGTATLELHNYAIDLGNNTVVLISSTEIEGADRTPAKDMLAGAKAGAIQSLKARLTSEKELTLQGTPGTEFQAESDSFRLHARMYMVGTKLLTVLAMGPMTSAIPANANRILDSLRLLKAPGSN